jgi:hypothetical protein
MLVGDDSTCFCFPGDGDRSVGKVVVIEDVGEGSEEVKVENADKEGWQRDPTFAAVSVYVCISQLLSTTQFRIC